MKTHKNSLKAKKVIINFKTHNKTNPNNKETLFKIIAIKIQNTETILDKLRVNSKIKTWKLVLKTSIT